MQHKTAIEWTHWPNRVGVTWNPIKGCSRVSEGCRNCYAERMAARFSDSFINPGAPFAGFANMTANGPRWTGRVELDERKLREPLSWKKPRVAFISMSDPFHEKLTADQIVGMFEVMSAAKDHVFIVLTKRPERIVPVLYDEPGRFYLGGGDYFPNIVIGTSVENQETADKRLPFLAELKNASMGWTTMVSYEPALGPVVWPASHRLATDQERDAGEAGAIRKSPPFDWLVAGGESGPGARPSHPDWYRQARDFCQAAGVPYFFKQWGAWAPHSHGFRDGGKYDWGTVTAGGEFFRTATPWNGHDDDGSGEASMICVGKKAAGSLLDGIDWKELPKMAGGNDAEN